MICDRKNFLHISLGRELNNILRHGILLNKFYVQNHYIVGILYNIFAIYIIYIIYIELPN